MHDVSAGGATRVITYARLAIVDDLRLGPLPRVATRALRPARRLDDLWTRDGHRIAHMESGHSVPLAQVSVPFSQLTLIWQAGECVTSSPSARNRRGKEIAAVRLHSTWAQLEFNQG